MEHFSTEPEIHSSQEEDTLSSTKKIAPEETATEQQPEPEQLLPPEAQGEVHGGPLGCCLGTMVGLLLICLLIIGIPVSLGNGSLVNSTMIPEAVCGAIFGAILGGYCGWKVGKRIYREYELSPRQKRKLEQLEQKSKR